MTSAATGGTGGNGAAGSWSAGGQVRTAAASLRQWFVTAFLADLKPDSGTAWIDAPTVGERIHDPEAKSAVPSRFRQLADDPSPVPVILDHAPYAEIVLERDPGVNTPARPVYDHGC